jgi:hypothetical protein
MTDFPGLYEHGFMKAGLQISIKDYQHKLAASKHPQKTAPSPKARQNPKILAPNGCSISSKALKKHF